MHRFSGFIFGFLGMIFLLGMSSCSIFKGDEESRSDATGWTYNDETYKTPRASYVEQETGPNLVFVEGGAFTMGATQDRVMYDWDNLPRRVTVTSFYMDQTEVTNQFYRDFLHWLKHVYYLEQNGQYKYVYTMALPDTLVWLHKMSYNEPMVNLYLRHPAYNRYPVVGVNWYQARRYSQWRSDRVNEMRLIEKGYFTGEGISFADGSVDPSSAGSKTKQFSTESYLRGKYEFAQSRYNSDNMPRDWTKERDENTDSVTRAIQMEDGIFLPDYRLPIESEWEYAAKATIGANVYENVKERKRYPWLGTSTRSGEVDDRNAYGMFNANFKRGRGDYMGIAGTLNDGYARPAPVGSFLPNDYGIYNLGGNVSEWVQDIYRQLSFEDVDDLNPFRGVYHTVPDRNAEIDPETMRIKRVPITPDNDPLLHKRRNFRRADYRNYLDGDWQSLAATRAGEWKNDTSYSPADPYALNDTASARSFKYYNTSAQMVQAQNPDTKIRPFYSRYQNSPQTKEMYNTGDYSKGKQTEATSLINDNARVYKGGSWKDRAYYLNPSVRRFLDADLSTDYIGFRCVMDRVGSVVPAGE